MSNSSGFVTGCRKHGCPGTGRSEDNLVPAEFCCRARDSGHGSQGFDPAQEQPRIIQSWSSNREEIRLADSRLINHFRFGDPVHHASRVVALRNVLRLRRVQHTRCVPGATAIHLVIRRNTLG